MSWFRGGYDLNGMGKLLRSVGGRFKIERGVEMLI